MRSQTRSMLAVLALAGLMGCQSSGRFGSPRRVQRVPSWPPPMTQAVPRSPSPWNLPRSERATIGKPVPIPTPDPQRNAGAKLSNEINVPEARPATPDAGEKPQVRFKPVTPNRTESGRSESSEKENGAGANQELDNLPPPLVVPKRSEAGKGNNPNAAHRDKASDLNRSPRPTIRR